MLFFSPIITRTGPLRIADCRATAAGPFCLRLGGKDGCQSVVFWVSVEMRPSTNDSLFVSFSGFISCVMYMETHWHFSRLIGFVVCAFYIPPIFLCILRWLSLHYTDAFCSPSFCVFLCVFSSLHDHRRGAKRRSRRGLLSDGLKVMNRVPSEKDSK